MKNMLTEYGLKAETSHETWDYSSLQTLANISDKFVRRFLTQCDFHILIIALNGKDSEELRNRCLENTSQRAAEILEHDINETNSSIQEIQTASLKLLKVMQFELETYENELWEEYKQYLTPDVINTEVELKILQNLTPEELKQIFDKMPTQLLIYAVSSDESWMSLFTSAKHLFSERAQELLTEELRTDVPDFFWQIEIAQKVMTKLGKVRPLNNQTIQ